MSTRDQELRFTVHDSPDYHQLKVSVFNDDKKTDLIGETWVSLEEVVIPGGGKKDLWHNLNCRGRYAGDIRIELTFYDTRPKEEKAADDPSPTPVATNQDKTQDTVGGPRQPKSVKRRPLPADPTPMDSSPLRPIMPEHSQSSPLPHTPLRTSQRTKNPLVNPTRMSIGHETPPDDYSTQYRNDQQPYNPESYDRHLAQKHAREIPYTSYNEQYSAHENDEYEADYSRPSEQHHSERYMEDRSQHQVDYQDSPSSTKLNTRNNQQNEYQTLDLPELPPYKPRQARSSTQPTTSQSMYGASYSNPATTLQQRQPIPDTRYQHQVEDLRSSRQPSAACEEYDLSPLRHQSIEHGYYSEPLSPEPFISRDDPPPPPPAHRSNGLRSLIQRGEPDTRQEYPQVAAPAPLNLRYARGNSTVDEYSHHENDPTFDDRTLSTSPSNTQLSIHSAPTVSSHTSYSNSGRRQSQGLGSFQPEDRYMDSTPPSLVPGYDPRIAEDESERIIHEKRMSVRPQQIHTLVPSYNRSPVYDPQPRSSHMVQHQAATRSLSHDEYLPADRTYPSPLAMIKSSAISSDVRTPMRKSVSPQPSFDSQNKASPIPFSPDSYDTLNPNLKSASSNNKLSLRYNTPEHSQGSPSPQVQDEKPIDEGPIIGSDGREIDPSDHLPTETWAPEPERKSPRKGPEITFRFRNSPQGAQPMPNAAPRPPRETVIRPHTISATAHSYSTSDISLTAATRNRLQKKTQSRPSYVQPASSPMIPTLPAPNSHSNPTTPYPLREHVNYGYGSSPTYGRGSPQALPPPPVPGKVLLGRGQEEWGADALSEEMKRIDIGAGVGSGGRVRRRIEG